MSVPTEITILGVAVQDEGHIELDRIFVPDQDCYAQQSIVTPLGWTQAEKALGTSAINFHLHSHGEFEAHPTRTDEESISEVVQAWHLPTDFFVSVVTNYRGDWDCRLHLPYWHAFALIPVKIDYGNPGKDLINVRCYEGRTRIRWKDR